MRLLVNDNRSFLLARNIVAGRHHTSRGRSLPNIRAPMGWSMPCLEISLTEPGKKTMSRNDLEHGAHDSRMTEKLTRGG